jgi:hypothetical protein
LSAGRRTLVTAIQHRRRDVQSRPRTHVPPALERDGALVDRRQLGQAHAASASSGVAGPAAFGAIERAVHAPLPLAASGQRHVAFSCLALAQKGKPRDRRWRRAVCTAALGRPRAGKQRRRRAVGRQRRPRPGRSLSSVRRRRRTRLLCAHGRRPRGRTGPTGFNHAVRVTILIQTAGVI